MTWTPYDNGIGVSYYGEGHDGYIYYVSLEDHFVGEYGTHWEKPRGEIFKLWLAKMNKPETINLCWCDTAGEARRFCEWTDRAYEKPSRFSK